MRGKSWYFSRNGRVEGPFTLENLKNRIQLNDNYLVWSPSFSKWKTAEDFFTQHAQQNKLQVKSSQAKTELSRSPHIEKQSTQVIPKSSSGQSALSASIDRAQQALSEFQHTSDEGSVLLNRDDPLVRKFTEQWNQLEQKQAAERRALLIRFFDENKQIENKLAENRQVARQQTSMKYQQASTARITARAAASGSAVTHGPENSSQPSAQQPVQQPSLRKKAAKQSRFTQETSGQSSASRHLKPVKISENQSQVKTDGSRTDGSRLKQRTKAEQSTGTELNTRVEQNNSRVESLQRTLKTLSGGVVSKPTEKAESDHEAMMKRVNRRRRRRAR